jgi:hypothetical protein
MEGEPSPVERKKAPENKYRGKLLSRSFSQILFYLYKRGKPHALPLQHHKRSTEKYTKLCPPDAGSNSSLFENSRFSREAVTETPINSALVDLVKQVFFRNIAIKSKYIAESKPPLLVTAITSTKSTAITVGLPTGDGMFNTLGHAD